MGSLLWNAEEALSQAWSSYVSVSTKNRDREYRVGRADNVCFRAVLAVSCEAQCELCRVGRVDFDGRGSRVVPAVHGHTYA